VERSVACFQALIEFNLFCPAEYLKYSLSQKLKKFEVFWDSEMPRFGDEGAKGWRSHQDVCEEEKSFFTILDFHTFQNIEDSFTRWKECEKYASFVQWLPARNSLQGK
jgi:hypothetical protein